jgi:YfiH family protein
MKRSMIWIHRKGLELGIFPVLDTIAPDLQVLFGSRRGGSSEGPYESLNVGMNVGDREKTVRRNRELLIGAAGIDGGRLARADQVHGAGLAVARRGELYHGVDGLVTREKDLTLAVSTADCYAVVIYAPSERVLGALHVGRNGAAEGIIERSMSLMYDSFRIGARGSIALIGPGICSECYQVGEAEAKRFPARFRSGDGGRFKLDLLSFCREELQRSGIRPDRIFEAGYCTSCNPRLFYSYRRDGGVTGRHWMLARIRGVSRS